MSVLERPAADRRRSPSPYRCPGRGGKWSTRVLGWNPGMRPSVTANSTGSHPTRPMQVLRGIAISPGIALGPVVVLDPRGLRCPPFDRRGGRRRTGAAGPGLEAARGGAGRDEAEVQPAGARVCRHPGGPQPDDRGSDFAAPGPQSHRAGTDRGGARHTRGARGLRVAPRAVDESHLAARAADLRDIQTRILRHLIGERPESFQDALARRDRPDARPEPQRSGGPGPRAGPRLRDRGRGPFQSHRDRGRRPGDPRRGRDGALPGSCCHCAWRSWTATMVW